MNSTIFYKLTKALVLWFKPISENSRTTLVVLVHIIQTACASYLAFAIRFESFYLESKLKLMLYYLPVLLVIRTIFYFQSRLNKDFWRYSSISDMCRIIKCTVTGSIVFFVAVRYVSGDTSYPVSIYVLDWLLVMLFSCGTRLSARILYREHLRSTPIGKKALVIGDSEISEVIIKNMMDNPRYGYIPLGIIDDDICKKGRSIHGISILGTSKMLPEVIRKYKPDEILISVTSSDNKDIRDVFELSKSFNIPIKKLPGLQEVLNGDVSTPSRIGERLIAANLVTREQIQEALSLHGDDEKLGIRLIKLGYIQEKDLVSFLIKDNGIAGLKKISLEDLLQREPVKTGIKSVSDFINGKSVLVTGAGGSIGSELCRQIIKYNPSKLILLDRYENGLFKIGLELRRLVDVEDGVVEKDMVSVIGDIVDKSSLERAFSNHRPQLVFHAAAHKHVPLMEANPLEAIKNNIFGTKNLIDVSIMYEVENFVMISTDKAVNPTSVMGATKRIAEFLAISMNALSQTKFTTVRFGNVLGSNGSVVPVFKEMLKKGGPLKVTHPDIKRYFMLIPEAVNLVLITASSESNGEIFMLDMGEQIKIVDLAENIIRLSGFIPHKEVKIEYSGLRPGEKMYEELYDKSEKVIPTFHEKIRKIIPVVPPAAVLKEHISKLRYLVKINSGNNIVSEIRNIIESLKSENFVSNTSNENHIYLKSNKTPTEVDNFKEKVNQCYEYVAHQNDYNQDV